ncbi:hypothetical protein GCM10011591_00700 [Nocardia camponoti]|uniref:Erythromycin esterase family protein n=1 Tax=Nocardia camponoti TaxID=1616106 RepID=A0A917Q7D3_9NOCA|nr:hypothetical protein GCM10011591_00700 [Nocardia camponoti]
MSRSGVAAHGVDDIAVVRAAALPTTDGVPSAEFLNDLVGDARIVMIGESSHGTQEFYAGRAEVTRWLIEQRGFTAVACEADWPDMARVNRFVRGHGDDHTAEEALRGFERFPTWMWRNTVVRDFVAWLRAHNSSAPPVGMYGLDLYSLWSSMDAVIAYLDTVDPQAAARARERYSCFDHVPRDDGQSYGFGAAFGAGAACEDQAVLQLLELQQRSMNAHADDDAFDALVNAQTVVDAEAYYRAMFGDQVTSWNLRDQHMTETLAALYAHTDEARIVVWAHNSHVGDARATQMGAAGEVTLGQLGRQRWGEQVRLIGQTTSTGTVTAAQVWDGPARRETVRFPLPASFEEVLHDTGIPEFALRLGDAPTPVDEVLSHDRLQRAIGVIYRPDTERQSHYYAAQLAREFDAVIHIDETTALQPLDPTSHWEEGVVPETYPTGL